MICLWRNLYVRAIYPPPINLYALESYEDYVKILKRKGIEVFSFDIEREKFPFDDGSIDIIIINQVMEHVKEVFWILHEVSRVLRVGGHFIVGVPNLASYVQRLLLLMGAQPSCIKSYSAHVRGYTKGDFCRLMDSGFDGYTLKGFGGSGFRPFPLFLAKPLARLFPTLSEGIFFDFQKTKNYNDNGYLKYPVEQQLETKFYLGI
jgi:SAM-dependent methyltransferase